MAQTTKEGITHLLTQGENDNVQRKLPFFVPDTGKNTQYWVVQINIFSNFLTLADSTAGSNLQESSPLTVGSTNGQSGLQTGTQLPWGHAEATTWKHQKTNKKLTNHYFGTFRCFCFFVNEEFSCSLWIFDDTLRNDYFFWPAHARLHGGFVDPDGSVMNLLVFQELFTEMFSCKEP